MTAEGLSNRLFRAKTRNSKAEKTLVAALANAGAKFATIGWDHYDNSVELYGVPSEHRLPIEAQRVVHEAGFSTVYVNHDDKWETHHHFNPKEAFAESKGWRVSYPHKRGKNEKSIWVEELILTWPSKWFKTGYVLIKEPSP